MKAAKARLTPAFTLTEVVIAIGIFAFAILGILGVMTTAMDNARLSATDTVLSAMTQEITTELRSQSFSNVFANVGNGVAQTNYFLDDGTRTTNIGTALFACRVSGSNDSTNGAYSSATLIKGTLEFSWPAQAPASNRSRTVIPFKLARYDS